MKYSLLLALSLLPAAAYANDIVAGSWDSINSEAHRLDTGSGSGVLLGNAGFAGLNSMAIDSSGRVYSTGRHMQTGANFLLTIDPSTGVGTIAAPTTLIDIRAMAFGPGDVLYAIEDGGSSAAFDTLYTLDTHTGAATLIAVTSEAGVQALAYGQGKLYAWEVAGAVGGAGLGLVSIDLSTGAIADINPAVGGDALQVQALAFNSAGDLFGARSELHSISTSDGSLTLVGSGGYSDVRGMVFSNRCAAVASAISRNSGTNPASYTSAAPILGGTFTARLEVGSTGHTLGLIVGFQTPLTLVLGGGQTLLVNVADASGELLGLTATVGPLASFSLQVPNDPLLCGTTLSTQGIHIGGGAPFVLSNALDLTLGH